MMQRDDYAENLASQSSRRRAAKACLSCRARKVRCDAVHRDGQCTNCALDNRQCIVKGRPSRYRSKKSETIQVDSGSLPTTDPPPAQRQLRFISENPSDYPSISLGTPSDSAKASPSDGFNGSRASSAENATRENVHGETGAPLGAQDPHSIPSASDIWNDDAATAANPSPDDYQIRNSHVIYSYFPFLEADLSHVSQIDVQFLESQGCFRVPTRDLVDEFIREYFLHVHPGLPMINEHKFWEMYSQRSRSKQAHKPLSLFLFQAMLFASCSFLPLPIIHRLGFNSIRTARGEYYRRAKLLFDFGAETNPVAEAQASLLMSYNAAMRNHKRANSIWLATAIQLAQASGADVCYGDSDQDPEVQNTLKRLWWCCIVRDRILPLGVRRQLHISMESFDLASMELTIDDFSDEIDGSQVYDPGTKVALSELFVVLCNLAVALTDTITTIYPMGGSIFTKLTNITKTQEMLEHVQSCKLMLEAWADRARDKFPVLNHMDNRHESTVLFTNLIYIYFHSARLALYQHESLILAVRSIGLQYEENRWRQSKMQLEDAAGGITENMKEIIHLKLGKYLPISIVAYAAIPVVLHILDVKLSSGTSQSTQKQRRLNVYMEAMKEFWAQYDGTDEVWDFIRSVIDYAILQRSGQGPSSDRPLIWKGVDPIRSLSPNGFPHTTPINEWGHLFLYQPTLFFQLTHTIDLSLSNGCYSEDTNFPMGLKSTRLALSRISMKGMYNAYPPVDDHETSSHHHTSEAFTTASNTASRDAQADMSNTYIPTTYPTKGLETYVCDTDYRLDDLAISSSFHEYNIGLDENDGGMLSDLLSL